MTLVTKCGLGHKSNWGEALVFCMGAAAFRRSLEGPSARVLWLVVSIRAVITVEGPVFRVSPRSCWHFYSLQSKISPKLQPHLRFFHLWTVMLCVWLRAVCKSLLPASWLHLLDKCSTQQRVVSISLHIGCGLCEPVNWLSLQPHIPELLSLPR